MPKTPLPWRFTFGQPSGKPHTRAYSTYDRLCAAAQAAVIDPSMSVCVWHSSSHPLGYKPQLRSLTPDLHPLPDNVSTSFAARQRLEAARKDPSVCPRCAKKCKNEAGKKIHYRAMHLKVPIDQVHLYQGPYDQWKELSP